MLDFSDKSLLNRLCERRLILKAGLVAAMSLLPLPAFSLNPKQLPDGKLTFYNLHTDEKLTVRFRNASGDYDAEALKDINWILRCHYTGQVHEIDRELIEILNMIDKKFGGRREIQVVSGFRSPEYNHMLANKSRRVADSSLHLEGKAIDIRISGVKLRHLRDEARAMRVGGVGYYRRSNFVHLDSGKYRTW